MRNLLQHWQSFSPVGVLLTWLVLLLGLGCSSQAPPAAPPTPDSKTSPSGGSGTFDDDDGFDAASSDDESSDDDSSSGFARGGAEVGDDDVLEKLKECIDEGKFFDRFADDGEGKCTRMELAGVECTEGGVQEHMSDDAKKAFKKALNGDFEDFQLDQCLDCPPDSGSSHCEGLESGDEQVGTKLYFVKEDDGELFGKAILIKSRPGK